MIFITLGSQKFQFNRLLRKIDELIENNTIQEIVYAQVGYSDYVPKNYEYTQFINQEKFKEKMEEASLVITHAGTGAIITALKKDKKVIAVPRLAQYGEHVDDHQIQILEEFEKLNLILSCFDIEQLSNAINVINNVNFDRYISCTSKYLDSIERYLETL